jgi:hypothetical protein
MASPVVVGLISASVTFVITTYNKLSSGAVQDVQNSPWGASSMFLCSPSDQLECAGNFIYLRKQDVGHERGLEFPKAQSGV